MKPTRRTLLVLLVCSVLYFLVFIPANRTGAQNPNLLAVFEVDEYAQYPYALHMLAPGATAWESLRNFLIYVHYFYGYPFYFFSALALLPVKLFLGANWMNQTQLIVTTLRQSISVLPMLLAVLLLVYMQTGFRSWWRSLGLFLLLLSLPAVVVNNLWWHVDSLVFLWIVLTLYFLQRDYFRYGRNFLLAAAACGLAAGTKQLGVFFVLAIPLYLGWGLLRQVLNWRRALVLGLTFVGLMILAIVVSNPLLLVTQYRNEIFGFLKLQYQQTSSGILLTASEPYFQWGQYPADFRIHYGELIFVLLALTGMVVGLIRPATRLRSALILAWIIPMLAVTVNFATRRTHYFIPVMMPLISCLVYFFPEEKPLLPRAPTWLRRGLPILLGLGIAVQFAFFLQTDAGIYTQQLHREQESASLQFSRQAQSWIGSNLPEQPLVIYRDWHVYMPEPAGWRVEMNWDLPNLDYLKQLNPDLVLLERENLNQYARPEVVQQAANPGNMRLIHEFYLAASQDALPGYKRVLDEPFGVMYARMK